MVCEVKSVSVFRDSIKWAVKPQTANSCIYPAMRRCLKLGRISIHVSLWDRSFELFRVALLNPTIRDHFARGRVSLGGILIIVPIRHFSLFFWLPIVPRLPRWGGSGPSQRSDSYFIFVSLFLNFYFFILIILKHFFFQLNNLFYKELIPSFSYPWSFLTPQLDLSLGSSA